MKCSGAWLDAYEKIAVCFNSKKRFAHPNPNCPVASKIDPNHPKEIRPGRNAAQFKAAYSMLCSQYTLIYNRWIASGNNGTEDKNGNSTLADHLDPFGRNKDDMAPFANFSDCAEGVVGPQVLEFMHAYCSIFPSLVPYILRTLPEGVGSSEGGVKKRSKTPRPPKAEKKGKLVKIEELLLKFAAPTQAEENLLASETRNNYISELTKLYELLQRYKELKMDGKVKKVENKIELLENQLGLD